MPRFFSLVEVRIRPQEMPISAQRSLKSIGGVGGEQGSPQRAEHGGVPVAALPAGMGQDPTAPPPTRDTGRSAQPGVRRRGGAQTWKNDKTPSIFLFPEITESLEKPI